MAVRVNPIEFLLFNFFGVGGLEGLFYLFCKQTWKLLPLLDTSELKAAYARFILALFKNKLFLWRADILKWDSVVDTALIMEAEYSGIEKGWFNEVCSKLVFKHIVISLSTWFYEVALHPIHYNLLQVIKQSHQIPISQLVTLKRLCP